MAGYRLFCLGTPILKFGDKPVKLEMRKSLALLVTLSMTEQDVSRETLAALFWPEFDQRHAQANLRRVLSSLNKSLEIELLKADRDRVNLRDRSLLWTDVNMFVTRLASVTGHVHSALETCPDCTEWLEEAIGLYRGDFLQGFNLGDCAEFDEWLLVQRENLCQEFGLALHKLSRIYASRSLWKPAIDHARRWVGLDRLNEAAQRKLISLYAQAGMRSAALRQYEELERLLQEEMGQAAEAETISLYQNILKGAFAPETASAEDYPTGNVLLPATEPLLKKKLYLPVSRGDKVKRLGLLHKLDGIEEHALTLISAPAGFGKTTALVGWLSQTALPCSWVSLDAGDNDPVRLLSYLVAALESNYDEAGHEAGRLLRSTQSTPPQFILATLIHALDESITEPYVLVLDDYQFITDRAAHDVIAFLVDHLPANMHLVLSTRVDPPLPLARLRSRGQLLEIRTDDLRFSTEEAVEYLNIIMGLKLTRPDVLSLEARIEGWVVGLQMAAISLRGRTDITSTIQEFSGSNRYILDYLVEEVISQQTGQIQEFLIKTCILDELSGPLCDHLLNRDEEVRQTEPEGFSNLQTSQAILEYLDRSNLFLIPLDEQRHWYRYHHLFAELLRARLKGYYPDQGKILHSRAAEWFEANQVPSDAIRHALAAKDFERAARLIEENALDETVNGEFATVLGWIRALPSECLRGRPWLSIRYAWAILQSGRLEGVDSLIEQAETWLRGKPGFLEGQAPSNIQDLQNEILTLQVSMASLRDDHARTISLAMQALDRLPENQVQRRINVIYALGNAYYITGDLTRASQVYQAARDLAEKSDFLVRIILASNKLAHINQVYGGLHEAYRIFQDTLEYVKNLGKPGFLGMGFIYCGIGEILYEWDRVEEARDKITEGLQADESSGVPSVMANSYTVSANLLIKRGELDEAEALLQKTAHLLKYPILPETIEMNRACRVKLWLAQGKSDEASKWAGERQTQWLRSIETTGSTNFKHELGDMALARVLLYLGNLEAASTVLSELARGAQAAGRNGRLIEILILQAQAAQMVKNEGEAFDYLEKALQLGEAEEYIRVFVDEGKIIEGLLQTGLEKERWRDPRRLSYVQRLMAACRAPNLTS